MRILKYVLLLSVFCIILTAIETSYAQPTPDTISSITITCGAGPFKKTGLMRGAADGDTYVFRLIGANPPTISAITWQYRFGNGAWTNIPTAGVTVTDWGTLMPGADSLTWTGAAQDGQTFAFKGSGKRSGCGTGGGGGGDTFEATWEGNVEVPKLELSSVTFGGGNHALQKDDDTFGSNGTGAVRVPQIQKTAGTGLGAGPPTVALAYDAASPVCYTWESSPSLSATFGINPGVAAPGIDAKFKVTGTVGATTLNYGEQTKTLQGNSVTVNFTVANPATDKLAKVMYKGDINLTWEVSFDSGVSWMTITPTTNKIFVTAGTPGGGVTTLKRIDAVTTLSSGYMDEQVIIYRLWTYMVGNVPYGPSAIPPSPLWKLRDGEILGECVDIIKFFKDVIAMAGLSPGDGTLIYAYVSPNKTSHESAAADDFIPRTIATVDGETTTFAFGHDAGDGHHLVSSTEHLTYLDKTEDLAHNYWEACYKYRPTPTAPYWYFPGGFVQEVGGNLYGMTPFLSVQAVMESTVRASIWSYQHAEGGGALGHCGRKRVVVPGAPAVPDGPEESFPERDWNLP